MVLSGLTVAAIDNVSQPLGGDFLCQVLDQSRLKIRILGQTGGPTLEPRITLFATGNNLTLLGDVVRRAVIARMDAACAEPWHRQFQVDPLAQVMADRGRYIAAALIAVRAFLLSGEPTQPPLASFATWSNWVRSAIVAFGYGDPVRTVATAVADDPDRQALGALLAAWWAAFGGSEISVADDHQARQRARHHRRLYGNGFARRNHDGRGQQEAATSIQAVSADGCAGIEIAGSTISFCVKAGTRRRTHRAGWWRNAEAPEVRRCRRLSRSSRANLAGVKK